MVEDETAGICQGEVIADGQAPSFFRVVLVEAVVVLVLDQEVEALAALVVAVLVEAARAEIGKIDLKI